MARGKKHTPEQMVSLLRQIEVGVANGKTTRDGVHARAGSRSRRITVGARSTGACEPTRPSV